MSEIEKLMQNAGIEKAPDFDNCYPEVLKCHHCEHYKVIDEFTGSCLNEVYPEFTAEKQLELIKWLCKTRDFAFEGIFINDIYYLSCRRTKNINTGEYYISNVENKKFEDALARLINVMWQDLSDTEKAEIREILG